MSRCWVLTEGIAGTENQCLGLAEAMGETAGVKRASPDSAVAAPAGGVAGTAACAR